MMHKGWMSILLLACLVTATVPATAQAPESEDARESIEDREGNPITFYGHILGVGRGTPVPMNTQFPEGGGDLSQGVFGNCGTYKGVPTHFFSGGDGVAGGYDGPCEEYASNENWWYTTAGFVQVKSNDEWTGYDQFHNERGQTKDIYFDLDQPIEARYWMSADFHGWAVLFCDVSICWNWDPGVLENWVVEATVYHGPLGEFNAQASEKPDMNNIYNNPDATVIAYGREGPKTLASIDSTLEPVAGPAGLCTEDGCQTANPFDITLEYSEEFIANGGVVPKEDDIVTRFQWYQEEDGEKYILGFGVIIGTAWNVNGGEDFPPTITYPIKNPLDVELVFPRFIHDKLVILGVLNTPWGSYDVDMDSIELVVTDESGDEVAIDRSLMQSSIESSVAHAGHYKPIDVTWIWDYQAQGLDPGTYTATVKASNFQGSYSTQTESTFTITAEGTGGDTSFGTTGLLSFSDEELDAFNQEGEQEVGDGDEATEPQQDEGPDDSQDTPGPAMALLSLALLGVALLRRRRGA